MFRHQSREATLKACNSAPSNSRPSRCGNGTRGRGVSPSPQAGPRCQRSSAPSGSRRARGDIAPTVGGADVSREDFDLAPGMLTLGHPRGSQWAEPASLPWDGGEGATHRRLLARSWVGMHAGQGPLGAAAPPLLEMAAHRKIHLAPRPANKSYPGGTYWQQRFAPDGRRPRPSTQTTKQPVHGQHDGTDAGGP